MKIKKDFELLLSIFILFYIVLLPYNTTFDLFNQFTNFINREVFGNTINYHLYFKTPLALIILIYSIIKLRSLNFKWIILFFLSFFYLIIYWFFSKIIDQVFYF